MGEKALKIGFYSSLPLENKANWSGTMYSMYAQLLKHGHSVEWIPWVKFSDRELRWQKFSKKFFEKIFNRTFNQHQNFTKAFLAGKKFKKAIEGKNYDIIFAPTATTDISFLKTSVPIFFLNDATTHQMVNYYPSHSGLGYLSKKITYKVEKMAFDNATAISFCSDWATNDAINFYKIEAGKVSTNRFGSNSFVPAEISARDYSSTIKFLFLGVDWKRKGGSIALKAIQTLRERGYPVILQVVGCVPPVEYEFMEVTPYLNKNIPEESQKIRNFFENAHFLFVPTRSECYGVVFCEASSYGIPAISTDTGGVSSIIINNETGLLLPPDAYGTAYADKIETLLKNPDIAMQMGKNARKRYEDALNWDVWGNEINEILQKISVK